MLRSLLTAATGLVGHQTNLDVVGRNIANANTVAFKRGRASFSALMGSSLSDASGSSTLGSGLLTGKVQELFTQGELQSTGNPLDFAIEGEGFFCMNLNGTDLYSRAGACALDSQGRLVNQSNGGIMQGYLADAGGRIRGGSATDIALDLSRTLPPTASTFISLGGRLDSDSAALGSAYQAGPFLREAAGDDLLLDLSLAGGGQELGLSAGEALTLIGWSGGSALSAEALEITETTTLADLASWLEDALRASDAGYPAGGVSVVDGRLRVAGGGLEIEGLQLECGGHDLLAEALDFPDSIPAGCDSLGSPGRFLAAAGESTLFGELYDRHGDPMEGAGSEIHLLGESLVMSAKLAGQENSESFEVGTESTLADFLDALESFTGAEAEMDAQGCILLEGDAGLAAAVDDLAVGADEDGPALGDRFHFTETQEARDAIPRNTSTLIIDAGGESRQLTLSFLMEEGSAGETLWTWTASLDGDGEIRSGGSGTLSFDEEGRASLAFDDGRAALEIAGTGDAAAQSLEIRLDDAEPLTLGSGGKSLSVLEQDGVEGGILENIEVDEDGIITGLFSNGEELTLAQIAVARFRNADGLRGCGDNLYSESDESGRPLWRGSEAGTKANRISVGSLELSNVDLAQEFASMITTQQGYQANTKVVSASNEMLSTVSRLKR